MVYARAGLVWSGLAPERERGRSWREKREYLRWWLCVHTYLTYTHTSYLHTVHSTVLTTKKTIRRIFEICGLFFCPSTHPPILGFLSWTPVLPSGLFSSFFFFSFLSSLPAVGLPARSLPACPARPLNGAASRCAGIFVRRRVGVRRW